jgi:hypothetical protein
MVRRKTETHDNAYPKKKRNRIKPPEGYTQTEEVAGS